MFESNVTLKGVSILQLTKSNESLMLEVMGGFDASELRLNSPFINFSPNSAVYADYCVSRSIASLVYAV